MTGNAANQERSANAKRVNAINVQQSNCLRLPTAVLTHKPDVASKKFVASINNVVTKGTAVNLERSVDAICVNAIIVLLYDYLNPLVAALTHKPNAV